MAKVEYKTSDSISGVFLLDRKSLEELDDIVGERIKNLRKLRNQEINKQKRAIRLEYEQSYSYISDDEEREKRIEERAKLVTDRYPLSRNEIEWTIELKSGEKVKVKSLRDAFTHERIKDQFATRLSLDIKCGRYECNLKFWPSLRSTIDVSVTPSHLNESNRIFAELETWIRSNALPKPYSWWRDAGWFAVPAIIWIALMLLFGWLDYLQKSQIDTSTINEAYQLRQTAEGVLVDGVSEDNAHKAIEILLKSELYGDELPTNAVKKNQHVRYVSPFKTALFAMIFPLVIFCIPPKSTLGMGTGEERIKRIRIWMKIVVVLLPTFLVMGVLASTMGSVLYSLF